MIKGDLYVTAISSLYY